MAFLSNPTYNRIAKNSDKAQLIFINTQGESAVSGALVNLTKTKSGKIKTRWETKESKNIYPLTHAALVLNGSNILVTDITPIPHTEYGFVDIDYEGESD